MFEDLENFYSINNSIIKDLFFFEIEFIIDCEKCHSNNKSYFINCSLDFQLEDILNEKKGNIDIYQILNNLNEESKCLECGKKYKLKRINSCPKFLIIIINQKDKNNLLFNINEQNDINNNISNKNKNNSLYELISFIIDDSETFCKSPVNNKWYSYKELIVEEKDININTIPHLLIYKNI